MILILEEDTHVIFICRNISFDRGKTEKVSKIFDIKVLIKKWEISDYAKIKSKIVRLEHSYI